MTPLTGIHLGGRLRALTAALLLGAALLSLPAGSAAAESKGGNNDGPTMCTMESDNADGSSQIDFYLPGEMVAMPGHGHYALCHEDGTWDYGGPIPRTQDVRIPTNRGGVNGR